LYKPLRESKLNDDDYITLPHETDEHFDTHQIIKDADIVFAEVSYPATGLGIELGWADANFTNIVCMYKEGTKISGSLKFICDKFIVYSDTTDMIVQIEKAIKDRKIELGDYIYK
jgi:hypothetical protein